MNGRLSYQPALILMRFDCLCCTYQRLLAAFPLCNFDQDFMLTFSQTHIGIRYHLLSMPSPEMHEDTLLNLTCAIEAKQSE